MGTYTTSSEIPEELARSLLAEFSSLSAEVARIDFALPPREEKIAGWMSRSSALRNKLDGKESDRFHLALEKIDERLALATIERRDYLLYQAGSAVGRSAEGARAKSVSSTRRLVLPSAITLGLQSLAKSKRTTAVVKIENDPQTESSRSEVKSQAPERTEVGGGAQKRKPPARQFSGRVGIEHRRSIRLDPLMAIEGRLAQPGSFEKAREIALQWLKKKKLRLNEGTVESFDIETKTGRVIAVGLPGVWAMQAETVDAKVDDRRWRVEMVLADAKPTPAVSVTLTAMSPGQNSPPAPSVPGLVPLLIQHIGLLDIEAGEVLSGGAIRVDSPAELFKLIASLRSPKRYRPAIILAEFNRSGRPSTLLNAERLAQTLCGVAKIYVLSKEMSWLLAEKVGKRLAVVGASIRLVRPGFTPDDDPSRHPAWTYSELTATGWDTVAVSSLLLREAAYASLRALDRLDAIPAFERVRESVLRHQLEEARQLAQPAAADGDRTADEVRALEVALRTTEELRDLYAEDNTILSDELQRVKQERDKLESRVAYLEDRVEGLLAQSSLDLSEPELPDSWDDLEDWCEVNLGRSVVVTAKAARAARSSPFEDISFVYRVLLFLAKTYVPSKRGKLLGGVEELNRRMEDLAIVISPVGRAAEQRKSKDTYSASYKGTKVSLDMHVKGSNDRDPRYGFRIYYHWHEEDGCVVVGSMPGHLDNGMT